MIYETSDVSICNGNIKDPIRTSTFQTKCYVHIFHVSVAITESLEHNLWFFNNFFLPQGGEIWEKQMIQSEQNLNLFDKMLFTMF